MLCSGRIADVPREDWPCRQSTIRLSESYCSLGRRNTMEELGLNRGTLCTFPDYSASINPATTRKKYTRASGGKENDC